MIRVTNINHKHLESENKTNFDNIREDFGKLD